MRGKNQHKIDWLARYRQAVCRQKRLEEDYAEFISTFALCKSPLITDMPTGSLEDAGLEKYFPKMEAYKEMISKQVDECMKLRKEIRDAITAIECKDSETYISLLFYRYIMGYDWQKIADEMYLSYDHVKGYLHGKALVELKINTQ